MGATGNGAVLFLSCQPGADLRDPTDDQITLADISQYKIAYFKFKDGLGLGMTAEDGTAAGCKDPSGNPYPRDGAIQGSGNHLVLTFGFANAGGNSEYIDIWLTRPNGQMIHVNPVTCTADLTGAKGTPIFGDGGHTLKYTWTGTNVFDGCLFRLGNQSYNQIFGLRYNRVQLQNDWNNDPFTAVTNLGQLRGMSPGTPVKIDGSSGTIVATTQMQAPDFSGVGTFFYIEQNNRSNGIRVLTDPVVAPVPGIMVSLQGVLWTDSSGNPCIDATSPMGSVTLGDVGATIKPVGLNNRSVGGESVSGGFGLANVGLLATAWGLVSNVQTDSNGNVTYNLDDGSGTQVSVIDFLVWDGVAGTPNPGEYWEVVGPVALSKPGTDYVRTIIVEGSGAHKVTQ